MKAIEQYKFGKKNGSWEYYTDHGKLIEVISYRNNQQTGPYKKYYPNGKVQVEGQYRLQRKESKWIYFDKGGDIQKTELYKQGELIKQTNESD